MVISQGEVWWAELPQAVRSEPAFRRPVVVVQGDPLNRSRIATVSHIVTLDKTTLTERVGKLGTANIELLLSGIDVVLGR